MDDVKPWEPVTYRWRPVGVEWPWNGGVTCADVSEALLEDGSESHVEFNLANGQRIIVRAKS